VTTRPAELDDRDDDRVPVVPFVPFYCPSCGTPKPFTSNVRGRTRWHRCKRCGLTYKSREMSLDEALGWRSAP
jgi:rubredoxin